MKQKKKWLETKNAFVCMICGRKFKVKIGHECVKNKLSEYFVKKEIQKLEKK